jgi:hypothetical protein
MKTTAVWKSDVGQTGGLVLSVVAVMGLLAGCSGEPTGDEPPLPEPEVEAAAEPTAEAATTDSSVPELTPEQLAGFLESGEAAFLDVRPPQEIEEVGTLPGYISIQIDELPDRMDELSRDRPLVVL